LVLGSYCFNTGYFVSKNNIWFYIKGLGGEKNEKRKKN